MHRWSGGHGRAREPEATMTFTQFIFPNGERKPQVMDVPDEIEKLAAELTAVGWGFEIECDPRSNLVLMDCCDIDEQLASRVCRNDKQVPIKVIELVREAHEHWIARDKPNAIVHNPSFIRAEREDREDAETKAAKTKAN